MRENLDITGGLLLAERVSTGSRPALGRMEAHEVVERAAPAARSRRSAPRATSAGDPR